MSAGRTVPVDNSAPTVAITSPANGASFSFLTLSTTLQASASDNRGVTQVVFYDGASVIGTDTTAPYSVSWSLGGVPKGTHTLTAKHFALPASPSRTRMSCWTPTTAKACTRPGAPRPMWP